MLQLTDDEVFRLGAGGFVQRDGFLDAALGDAARDRLGQLHRDGVTRAAGVGRDGQPSAVRGDETMWLEPTHPAPLPELFHLFERLRAELSDALRLRLQRFAVQAARYEVGAGYLRHVDAFRGEPTRVVTAIVYLNPDWVPADGGQLRVWTPDGAVDVAPCMGRLVVFLSHKLPHEVLPAGAPRWAVTAWYRAGEALPLLPDP